MSFECIFLHDVRVIDVIFDRVSNRIVPAYFIQLKIGLMMPSQFLGLSLMLYLLAYHQLLLSLSLSLNQLHLHLSSSILF